MWHPSASCGSLRVHLHFTRQMSVCRSSSGGLNPAPCRNMPSRRKARSFMRLPASGVNLNFSIASFTEKNVDFALCTGSVRSRLEIQHVNAKPHHAASFEASQLACQPSLHCPGHLARQPSQGLLLFVCWAVLLHLPMSESICQRGPGAASLPTTISVLCKDGRNVSFSSIPRLSR